MRKLKIRSETIRQLGIRQLGVPAGGTVDTSIIYDCATNASWCDRSCFSSCNTIGGTTSTTTFRDTGEV